MPEAARSWNEAPYDDDADVPRSRPRLVDVSAPARPAPGTRRTVKIRGQVAPPRRRPAPRAHERVGPRPDRIALWAVVLGLFLILVAATSSNAASHEPYRHVAFGARTLQQGKRGDDVRMLQRLVGVGVDGDYGPATSRAVKAFQRAARLTADGRVGPLTRAALVHHRMFVRTASYYGPGLYGNRTACGQRLTSGLRGVAHRSLPCGTVVTIEFGGRFTSARVVDRGPHVHGVTLDLTAATARSVGMHSTERIRVRS